VIRAAVPADQGQVAALAAALAQSFPFSPAAFAASYPALLAAPDACLLVADTGAALAGYLLGFRHLTFFAGGPVGWVEEVLVTETDRGQGTGRALMGGVRGLGGGPRLCAGGAGHQAAAPFYRALGYEESAAYYRRLLTRPSPAG